MDAISHCNALQQIKHIIDTHSSLCDAYDILEPIVLKTIGAERICLFRHRRQYRELVTYSSASRNAPNIRVPINAMSLEGYVAVSQHPLVINEPIYPKHLKHIHPHMRFSQNIHKDKGYKTHSLICVPITNAGVLIGVIHITNKHTGTFTKNDIRLTRTFATQLGSKYRFELGGTEAPFEFLIHQGLLDERTLNDIRISTPNNQTIIQRLISHLRIPEHAVGNSLSLYYQVPFIPYLPDQYQNIESANRLNLSYLKRNVVALLTDAHDKLIVLMAEPDNLSLLSEIESAANIESYEIAVSLPHLILQYLGERRRGDSPGEMNDILDEISASSHENEEVEEELPDDAPAVVRLVSRILHDAKRLNASDIHIDPEKNAPTRVRMRIDGICRDTSKIPNSHHNAVVARIKIMSHLNIAEKRVPQDGKLSFRTNDQRVEVRTATIPTVAGEGVALRILASGGAMPIETLNLAPNNRDFLERMINKPHGILLVAGPTGSGKTTTLHAILGYLNTSEKKIWTAEDPVEITQPGLQQVQVNPKIGFTFANALRAFLRADPDIILIGEMRDKETAHAGVAASLTGHLVLSTLHTNSAPETITRLLDLGIDPVNFSDACVGVIAQRLVRTLCTHCKEKYVANATDIAFIERQYGSAYSDELTISTPLTLYKAKGCDECGHTGYKGRTGVHELLRMTNSIRSLIYEKASVDSIKKQATQDGMRSLVQDTILKALTGNIDLAQVQAVGGE